MDKEYTKKVDELLSRSVVEFIDNENISKKLYSGEKLRIKFGVDPTSPNLHIGRAVSILKLKDFQDLGHIIVFIIGDFTGVIGDTSDKDSERPMLDEKVIGENLKTYKEQVGKILDMEKIEFHFNSTWLSKLGFSDIGRLADLFSVSDFIARENIKKRLDIGKRVSLREVLYPLMQGYDSVAVNADIEIGGSDQKFNLLAGRNLQREFGQEPQAVMMLEIIEGLDGRKMSSSWGNTVNLNDEPSDMYGKIMSLRDELVERYFNLCTRVDIQEIEKIMSLENPKESKMKLAFEIVRMYHGEEKAKEAQEAFVTQFSKKEIPENIQEYRVLEPMAIVDILVDSGMTSSRNESRRKIDEGAVKINDERVSTYETKIEKGAGEVVRFGRKLIKLI